MKCRAKQQELGPEKWENAVLDDWYNMLVIRMRKVGGMSCSVVMARWMPTCAKRIGHRVEWPVSAQRLSLLV